MSTAMLTTLSFNFYMFSGTSPSASTASTTAPRTSDAIPLAQQGDERKPFRERSLVSAIMSGFQALGVGQSNATVTGTTSATTDAATTAPETLEQAVNAFAHSLSEALQQQGQHRHSSDEQGGEQAQHQEGHGRSGYQGLVHRLEQLAQSLAPATASAVATELAISTASATAPAKDTSTTPASGTQPVDSNSSNAISGLLAAFAKVMQMLQAAPASTGSASATPSGTTDSQTSTADKLRLFLTTLAQSLHAHTFAAPLSPVGARLNLTI